MWGDKARRLLDSFSADADRARSAHTHLMLALDFATGPSNEVVIAGDPAAADTKAMLEALRKPFLPNKVVLLGSPGDAPTIAALAPYTNAQTAQDAKATAYVCRNCACNLPTTDPAKMMELLKQIHHGLREPVGGVSPPRRSFVSESCLAPEEVLPCPRIPVSD